MKEQISFQRVSEMIPVQNAMAKASEAAQASGLRRLCRVPLIGVRGQRIAAKK